MNKSSTSNSFVFVLTAIACGATLSINAAQSTTTKPPSAPILMDQLGAVAGQQYQGDGLSVTATRDGVRLRCVFQRLAGLASSAGLWLNSTANHASGERFRILATALERTDEFGFDGIFNGQTIGRLPDIGDIKMANGIAQFVRPDLTEEYSVSVDGVRQDFVINQRPAGAGKLRVALEVTGATVAARANGVHLTLRDSGRQLAYNRLLVTDAAGRTLAAGLEVSNENHLAVIVDDADAIYPVRIDPTFSDADWASMGALPGTDKFVATLAFDGAGNLFIGGDFTEAGNVLASRIVKWDGNNWTPLAGGLNGMVYSLAVSGSTVFAGGAFTTATNNGGVTIAVNYIAAWDGNAWSALGAGMGGAGSPWVQALALSGGNVFAGGSFTTAGGNSAYYIAKWNGATWSPVGEGVDGRVSALVVSGTDVYVGGDFITATNTGGVGVAMNRITKWDGTVWVPLGGGFDSSVYALFPSGSDLYVGGNFHISTNSGGASVTTTFIAKWDGANWSALGSGMNSYVQALAVSGGYVYAGGNFTTAGGSTARYVARWDGSSWLPAIANLNNRVSALAISGSDIYAGGIFTPVQGGSASDVAKFVAKYDTTVTNWLALTPGLGNAVSAVAVWNGEVYAGGTFTISGNPKAKFIAKWNGDSWAALGDGVDNYVSSLLVFSNALYVGGSFNKAGGTNVNRIARWDGNNWSALGTGMNNSVYALAPLGNDLYAGGAFSLADGNPASRIARWDGTNWSALASGLNNNVLALSVIDTNLFAGGSFTTAGGNPANYIARWDGNNWSALGSGLNNAVQSLAAANTNLFVGGAFSTAGGSVALRIARWNGSAWATLGAGVGGNVTALVASETNLYVGGTFATAGGAPANHIASWNGSSWSVLGSGVNNSTVNGLALSGGDLYVGGDFTLAGGKVSAYIAKAVVGQATSLPGRFTNTAYSSVTGFSCTFLDATIGQPYRVQSSPSLSPIGWSDYTNFTYTGPIAITDATAGSGTNKFFRAVTP